MKRNTSVHILFTALLWICSLTVSQAQLRPLPATDQKSLLKSNDPQLAKNKKIVYDFWREVLEAGHLDLAEKYMTETYMQHNPNVSTGRQGFVDLF